MGSLLVEGEHFQLLVGKVENRAARGLIDAVVLHADEPVFHNIENADAVLAAQLVELRDDLRNLHLFSVDRNGHARLKVDGNLGRNVGRLIGRDAHFQELRLVEIRLVCRVFEVETLVAQVPEVLVLGVVGLSGNLQRHIVCLGVVDFLVSGLDAPLSPRRDDRHAGRKILDCQLKADLIVSFAGAAVGNGIRALGKRNLGKLLADDGSCKRRAEQVLFILRTHHDRRDDNLVAHFIDKVSDDQLACAGLKRLFLQTLELVALTDVGGNSDDFGVIVVFLQPGNDDGRIQTARVGENDFLDGFLFHDAASASQILWINIISFCIKIQYASCTNCIEIFPPFCIFLS